MRNDISQVVLAVQEFIRNGKKYYAEAIDDNTSIDTAIPILHQKFRSSANNPDEAAEIADSFFVFSKWNLYKTIYTADKEFYRILADSEDIPIFQAAFSELPYTCFFVKSDAMAEEIGYFVYAEVIEDATLFYLIYINDVDGNYVTSYSDALWVKNGQKLSEALDMWKKTINPEQYGQDFFDRAQINMKNAVQVAYYISSINAIIKEIKIPKDKRPKTLAGKAINIHHWHIGYHIPCDYFAANINSYIFDSPKTDNDDEVAGGNAKPLPQDDSQQVYVRKAHWHYRQVGEGNSRVILKWVEPVWTSTPSSFSKNILS